MKRQILSLATALVLTTGGAIFAQSTLNTQAPGPSQETKPGQTNNNLQNPGSNMQKPSTTTTTTTSTVPSTATTTSTDMNNDSTVTPPADTTTTTTTTTPTTDTTTTTPTYNSNSGTTGSTMDNTSTTTTTPTKLPKTASDMPTVALMGLLALSGFFGVRAYAKRNA
jgi:LPXTG-motif cell wall-anchored protein